MSSCTARCAIIPASGLLLCFWLAPCLAAEAGAPPAAPNEPLPALVAPEPGNAVKAGETKAAEAKVRRAPKLVSDEPNTLGVAEDGYEGHPYMDFNISVRYPLGYDAITEGRDRYAGVWMPYFSFTARASQYFNRRSAPVVTKRFNPKLMLRVYQSDPPEGKRIWVDDGAQDYYDFGYAHESNGQFVNSPAAFDAVAANFSSTDVAQDYVHRGWDYLDLRRHSHFRVDRRASLDVELKYFLNHGLAQSNIMETYPWEPLRPVTHISEVDGVRVSAAFDLGEDWFKNAKLTWMTGYRQFARYNTGRAEATFVPLSRYLGVPIVLWAQTGYDNNVARFYQRSWYAGIACSFETEQ